MGQLIKLCPVKGDVTLPLLGTNNGVSSHTLNSLDTIRALFYRPCYFCTDTWCSRWYLGWIRRETRCHPYHHNFLPSTVTAASNRRYEEKSRPWHCPWCWAGGHKKKRYLEKWRLFGGKILSIMNRGLCDCIDHEGVCFGEQLYNCNYTITKAGTVTKN